MADKISGIILIVLGAASYYGGSLLAPVPGQQVGPAVFPMLVGACLALCGALIAFGVGSSIEQEAEADLAAHSDTEYVLVKEPFLVTTAKTLLPPALLLFYVAVADTIGFLPTAFIIVLAIAKTMGAPLKPAIALAILGPLAVNIIFLKLLRVPLPPGFTPLPW